MDQKARTYEIAQNTYSLADLCAASGVQRATLHSWLSRHYLPTRPGLGMGRERRFTLLDAVWVAVLGELISLGVIVGVASAAARMITNRELDERRFALIMVPSALSGSTDGTQKIPPAAIVRFTRMDQIEHFLLLRFGSSSPVGFLMLDITAIADRTRTALENPGADRAAQSWLDESVGLAAPQPSKRK